MAYCVMAVGFEAELETDSTVNGSKTVKCMVVVHAVYKYKHIFTITEVAADSSTSMTFKLRPVLELTSTRRPADTKGKTR
jgi:hypothetical protein